MASPKNKIIRTANRLLATFLKDDYLEEFLGDLQELQVERENSRGPFVSTLLYVIDSIHLLIGFSSFKIFKPSHNPATMLRHYFTISTRSILNNKANTFINVFGLSLGIAGILIIAFIIDYELKYDSFHTNSDRIYRVVRVSQVEGETEYRTGTSWPLSPAMKDEIAALQHLTFMMYFGGAQIDITKEGASRPQKYQEDNGFAFVSESFFEIFDFKDAGVKWLYGDPGTALDEPNSIVLTQSLAQKFFGTSMVVGRSMVINQLIDVTITGVITDLPSNTDFPFTMICSYSSIYNLLGKDPMESWGSVSDSHQTYIILPESMSPSEMDEEITKVHEKYVSADLAAMRKYRLQPLSEVHRDSRFGNYNKKFTSMKSIWILATVGIFLLIMISINFINTTIAKSISRSREMGLRKVMGSNRSQIVLQFLTETFIITCIAATVAILTTEAFKTELQSLFDFRIAGLFIANKTVVFLVIIIIATITVLAGFFPALTQTARTTTMILKNTITSRIGKSIRISNALTLVQFSITIMLVTGTLIVRQQLRFFNTVDLGFDKEAVVNVPLPNNQPSSLSTLKKQLLENSAIAEISYSSTLPSGLNRNRGYMDIHRKGFDARDGIVFEYQSIDPNYLELYNLELEAGNNIQFSDTNRSVIINRTLMNKLGYTSFEECLGSEVELGLNSSFIVTGVLKDFHNQSLKDEFGKIAMVHNPTHFRMASIKLHVPADGLDGKSLQQSIQYIGASWKSVFPDSLFDYEFLDENIAAFYKEEQRFSKMFQYLSFIFLVIGCLGIYGLISFIINKKMTELAIRKVLGASLLNITVLLLRNYFILIMVALAIAVPVVYSIMNSWLQNFEYHIDLHWWFFIVPAIMVLLITFVTVSRDTLCAVKANPANTLRQE